MNAIEIEGLTKKYRSGFFLRSVTAVENLSLSIKEGEITGFLGPNGAGKTTTIKSILGIITPTAGTIKIFGEDPKNVSIKNRIGFLPEEPYFYDYLKGYEFLKFYGNLFGIEGKTLKKRIDVLLDEVKLTFAASRPLKKYSKGMLQRIGIAQALINDPDLIILDEPMSGIDPIGRKDIREIILNLKDKGKTIFFSSHILSDVEMICDCVAIINKGHLIEVKKIDEIRREGEGNYEITVKAPNTQIHQLLTNIEGFLKERGGFLVFESNKGEKQKLLKKIMDVGGEIISVSPAHKSLEEIFFEKIENK
ncbi:MAG: ABC transporter ATP-binding protein [Candidatus Schekmanbacteria bacterium]|nr:MAG: ABC transporter ATP-binding protein [Candidatus Schekmanbacteria bacterium]